MSTCKQFENGAGRKKFGTSSKIKNELRREIRRSVQWIHNTPGDLLKLFEYDYSRRYLPIRGNSVIKFSYNLIDVLSLLRTFKVQIKEVSCAKKNKLAQSPIFSATELSCLAEKELGYVDEYPYFCEGIQFSNAEDEYNELEHLNKFEENYVVDGSFHYSISDTMMCVIWELFDLYLQGSNNIELKLLKVLSHSKYKRLDPYGVYIIILHMMVRGLAKLEWLRTLSTWDKAWSCYTTSEKNDIIWQLESGKQCKALESFQQMLIAEMQWKYTMLRHEGKLLRYTNKIGSKPFDPKRVKYLTWYRAIWSQMSDVEKYRSANGLRLNEFVGTPTMFSVRKDITDAVDESLPKIQETLIDTVKHMMESPEVKTALKNVVTESMEPTLDNFEKKTQKVSASVIDNLKASMEPVVEQTFSLFSSINGMVVFLKSIAQQAMDAFPKEIFGINCNLDLSLDKIIGLIKYYIVYVNVESRPLKLALIYLMLKEIGLLEYILKYGAELYKYMTGNSEPQVETRDGNEIVGEPTSETNWLTNIVEMVLGKKNEIGLCTFFTALLVMIYRHVCGVKNAPNMRASEYATIGGVVMGICKGFHWIGSGMFGIDRIYKYFMVVTQALTKFVREKILKIDDDVMKNERDVAKWLTMLKFFSTDTGRNAIRVSAKLLERAERIMPDGLAFISKAAKDPKFISRDSIMQIHRSWNDVKVLSNYTYRLRSTSNFKPAMFHIQFVGEPGIGKSTLTEKFINKLSEKVHGADELISHWTYNPNVDHFDGYNGQTYMIIDDLFRYNEPKHLSLIIGLITNTPVPLPMAHLEDKGVHLDSDILISSTNVPYPIGKDIFCMEAVHRRRHVLCEVTIDPRVKKDGKFSGELFKEFYPGQDSHDFPHLKFSLMKPVVTPGEDPCQYTDRSAEKYKFELIKKLQEANQALKFDPDFYFGENARPLEGMSVPCRDWTFEKFIENVAVAYESLRAGERKLTQKGKYEHVMECFAELDNLFAQSNDFQCADEKYDIPYADPEFRFISDRFLDASLQYGRDDPLGEKIYLNPDLEVLAPDLADLDIDAIIDEFNGQKEGKPTSDYATASTSSRTTDWVKSLPRQKLSVLTSFMQTVDIKEPTRSIIMQMMHACAIEREFTEAEKKVWKYVVGEDKDPYEVERHIKDVPSNAPEMSRRERIMNRVKKQVVDPHYDNMLSVKLIRKDDGSYIPAIPIQSHCTQWDGLPLVDDFPGADFENYLKSNEMLSENMVRFCEEKPGIRNAAEKFLRVVASDHKFYYPCKAPFSMDQWKQGNSNISLEFLRRLIYANGNWHLNVSDLDQTYAKLLTIRMAINGEYKLYYVPMNIAFYCSISKSFMYTSNLFTQLTSAQQKEMVETAKWMHEHMFSLTNIGIRERLFTCYTTVKRSIMAHAFYTLDWIWSQMSTIIRVVSRLALLGSMIFFMRTVASMFSGSKEPTSKFLHRAQVRTGMQYKGQVTDGIFNPRQTQEILAQKYLDKNVKFFEFVDVDNCVHLAHGIHTKQFLIVNKHVADTFERGITMVYYRPTSNSDRVWELEIHPNQVYSYPGNDLAIIFSRHLPMASDIVGHFITDEDFDNTENVGELWSLTNYDHQQSIEIRDKCAPYTDIKLTNDDGTAKSSISKAISVEGVTVSGCSGSMLMRPSKKPGHRSIVGIQAWKVRDYYTNTIFYQVVTQSMIQHMITKVEEQVGRPVITQTGPLFCEPTSAKAEGIVDSHINVEGSVPKESVVGMIGRTQFRKTAIAPFMDQCAMTSPRVPAALNPWDHRLLSRDHPMKHSVNKHGTGKVGSFDLVFLDRATQDMAYWLRERLDVRTFNTNLSIENIITGTRSPGCNPVDCRKSAGLPFVLDKYPGKPKGKKAYVDIDENGQCVINSPEFIAQFEHTYSQLQHGIIPKHSSYDFPKDELRPFYKALGDPVMGTPPKTRSVTCMSMEMIFAWRRVTLELMASLHRAARGNFPFGPGINPEGPDWTRLFHYLNKHPNCMDFDVSNWDGHMPPELLYAVGDMLVIILGKSYHSPEAKVIYSLLTEVLFGHVQFEDLVYQKCRGLISGFPGTAEVNTLVHLLLMYYYYLYTAYLTDNTQYSNINDFFLHISPVFYGDDVIMSVSDEILPWFNGETICKMYVLHGYPVTSASKEGEIAKAKKLKECTFLKSGFNFISPARVDRVMDISVCYDLMYWVRAKEHPYDQFRSNLFDSFRLIHGHGRTKYEDVRTQVNGWLRQAHLQPFDFRWDDFENDKIQKYFSS